MRRILNAWRNLTQRDRVDRDLDDEVRAAFELLVDEKVNAGSTPEDARRAARLELGDMDVMKEQVRDVRAGGLVDQFMWDAKYAIRLLGRNPVFAFTASLSLAIGIGAATTIFTIANGLLLRAAPGVSESDRLVDISHPERAEPIGNPTTNYPIYLDIRERASTLGGVYIHQAETEPMLIGADADRQRIFATIVSATYFDVLGVRPTAGRLFSSSDSEDRGGSRIVVLSHAFWARHFKSDPSVVGQTVTLNGEPFMVVGVAGEGFWGTTVVSSDVWVLIGARPFDRFFYTSRRAQWGLVGARLKSGVSMAQAAAELDAISAALEQEYPSEVEGRAFLVARASPIPPTLRVPLTGFLAILMALVLLVLVITCANLAGVLLARAAARRREIAVRIAIGAGRKRLVRQLLTETLFLFILGGGAGLLLARWMTTLLLKLLPVFPLPVVLSMPLDGRVVFFAAGISLVAAVLCGLAPALHVSKADVVSGLKDDVQGPHDRLRLRNAFVVAQVAFSVVLIVAAGVLGRAMARVVADNPGFNASNLESATLDLSQYGYTNDTGPMFIGELAERLRTMPGVEGATVADHVPMRGLTIGPMQVPGVAPADGRPFFAANWNRVDVGYFEALQLPLVSGRDFSDADRAGTQPVAIIAQAGARQLWPGEDPIGKYIQWRQMGPDGPGVSTDLQIVGVARDLDYGPGRAPQVRELRERGPGSSAGPAAPPAGPPLVVYVPLRQRYTPQLSLLVRTVDGRGATRALGDAIAGLNSAMPRITAEPVGGREAAGPVQLQLRVASAVAGTLGLVGVLLAAIGIYGVTAYTVTRRTREIGIRIAMGAERGDIVRMVLGRGMMLVGGGAVLGLALAAAGGRLLARVLFGAPPLDPLVFAGAAVLFTIVGLTACYVPTRRATRIDAMEALRYE